MKPSFKKFTNYLTKRTDLSDRTIDCLHSLIFMTPQDKIIDARSISIYCDISIDSAYSIIYDLHQYGIIEIEEVVCSSCDNLIPVNEIENDICPECESLTSFKEKIHFKIEGILDYEAKQHLKRKDLISRKAERLSDIWEENGFITYLIIDLVNSQKIQAQGDNEYNRFLELLREILTFKVLSQIKGEYFSLGEIGDAHKLAFTDPSDAIRAIEEFSKSIYMNEVFQTFTSINKRINLFPKFTAVVDILDKPIDNRGIVYSPKQVITTTLSGALDLNTIKLTRLFRLDAAVGSDLEALHECDITVWAFSDFLDRIDYEYNSELLKPIMAKKDDSIVASGKALFLGFRNGKHCNLEYKKK